MGGGARDQRRAMLPPMLTARTGQAPVTTLKINPRIFAIAVMNGILGAVVGVLIFPLAWSADGDRNLAAAQALAAGVFGQDHTYLYSPLAAALTIPFATSLPHAAAIAGWLVGRLGALAAGVARQTRGLSTPDRMLVAIAAISFVPTMYDLLLGNVTILVAAVVALVAWSADGYLAGLPLGLMLATIPKPALIPVLLWMLVFRRRAFLSAVGSAAVFSLLGLVLLGASAYGGWLQVLLHPYYLGTQQLGNLALGAMLPAFLAWPLMAITVVVTFVALRRGETPGFIACLCAGLLVAPYTIAYGAVLLLLAVGPLARVAPMRTFALALSGSLGILIFMPLWVGAILVTTLAVPRTAWTNLNQGASE
jgi:Glycosyltransferase family 87